MKTVALNPKEYRRLYTEVHLKECIETPISIKRKLSKMPDFESLMKGGYLYPYRKYYEVKTRYGGWKYGILKEKYLNNPPMIPLTVVKKTYIVELPISERVTERLCELREMRKKQFKELDNLCKKFEINYD